MAKRPSRKHANKECFLCERKLSRIERDGCGSSFDPAGCWWLPAIKEHGLDEAVKISSRTMVATSPPPSTT